MTNLNTNEKQVLQAVINAADDNGGDFTYMDDVINEISVLTTNQVKGYFSQLQKKNYIYCCESGQICAGDKFKYCNFNEPNYTGA